jgi:hypothetical protein
MAMKISAEQKQIRADRELKIQRLLIGLDEDTETIRVYETRAMASKKAREDKLKEICDVFGWTYEGTTQDWIVRGALAYLGEGVINKVVDNDAKYPGS